MQELEKILEEINEIEDEYTNEDHDIMFKLGAAGIAGDIKDIVRKHMHAGWIPVEERLPIPNKEVWVTVKRNGTVFTSTDAMTKNGGFWNYEKENILAWKEKDITPDPYQPERRKHDC